MLRALVLLVAFCLFRTIISRRRQRSSTAMSPYMNAFDGTMSVEQVSQALERYRGMKISRP